MSSMLIDVSLRSGTLWEGRHKGSVIDADYYLLNCYRYIELNPVRASMLHLQINTDGAAITTMPWERKID